MRCDGSLGAEQSRGAGGHRGPGAAPGLILPPLGQGSPRNPSPALLQEQPCASPGSSSALSRNGKHAPGELFQGYKGLWAETAENQNNIWIFIALTRSSPLAADVLYTSEYFSALFYN